MSHLPWCTDLKLPSLACWPARVEKTELWPPLGNRRMWVFRMNALVLSYSESLDIYMITYIKRCSVAKGKFGNSGPMKSEAWKKDHLGSLEESSFGPAQGPLPLGNCHTGVGEVDDVISVTWERLLLFRGWTMSIGAWLIKPSESWRDSTRMMLSLYMAHAGLILGTAQGSPNTTRSDLWTRNKSWAQPNMIPINLLSIQRRERKGKEQIEMVLVNWSWQIANAITCCLHSWHCAHILGTL